MIVLGIETSCDETAVALVDDSYNILAQRLTRQIEHERWGGVVPETASRAHLELLDTAIRYVLLDASLIPAQLSGIAVTTGPGLAGALWVGAAFADGFSLASGVPIIPVHHLEAHLWSALFVDKTIATPFLALLVSGGHTLLIRVNAYRNYEIIGTTRDDAAGEAFDKAARLLELGFPGGPAIANAAHRVKKNQRLPKLPIADLSPSFDFSFSGLKSALKRAVDGHPEFSPEAWAASFETAAIESLLKPVMRYWQANPKLPLIIGGGVAANQLLRKRLTETAEKLKTRFFATPIEYCTDNGAMIALAGVLSLEHGFQNSEQPVTIHPRFPISQLTAHDS
ncbi:MAG: tRNA (adenosine(37)-N6)-threonylcarbamoyltransferase complex transferase subunit TsaD [bacterium]|nr:tRNA (adenosine(37)-N6)-threonylcarbamoyltransferase complex transferase subunit TsaD [bacterium]